MTPYKQFEDSVTGSTLSPQFRQARIRLALIIGTFLTVVLLLSSLNIYQNTRIGFDAYRQRVRQGFVRVRNQQQTTAGPVEFEPYSEDLAFVARVVTLNNLILLGILTFATWIGLYFLLRPLDESVRRREKFVAEASHELRTPLAILYSELSLSEQSHNIDNIKKTHLEALSEIKRLQSLSDSLLNRHSEVNPQTAEIVSVQKIILEVWDKLQKSRFCNKSLSIIFEPVRFDLKLKTQKISFWQVIYSILENVFKHAVLDSQVRVITSKQKDRITFQNQAHKNIKVEPGIGQQVLMDMVKSLGMSIDFSYTDELYEVTLIVN